MLIAVGEACANAIEHAGAAAGSTIEVRAQLVGREVVLRICDHGRWRTAAPRSQRGHGLRLMRVLMDAIDIATVRDGAGQLRGAAAPAGACAAATAATAVARRAGLRARRRGAGRGTAGRGARLALSASATWPSRGWRARSTSWAPPSSRGALTHATRAGDRGLVLDVNGVGYLDSAGLHLLHDTSRTLAARGQSLRVVVARDAEIARLLEIVDIGSPCPSTRRWTRRSTRSRHRDCSRRLLKKCRPVAWRSDGLRGSAGWSERSW